MKFVLTKIYVCRQSEGLEKSCVCDSVLRPLFWRDFMPAYLWCGGDLVCILR